MKNELISALKNQLVLALVVAGTITIAIPIFVCGLIGVLLEFSLLLVASKTLAVTEKLENWRKPPTQMEHCNRNDRYEPADFAPARYQFSRDRQLAKTVAKYQRYFM